jgi:hypothetical protein
MNVQIEKHLARIADCGVTETLIFCGAFVLGRSDRLCVCRLEETVIGGRTPDIG